MSSFFKGAVSTVGGAAASVGSVVGVGGNRRSSMHGNTNEIILKEKFNLTIKETLNKDAQSVNSTSIRSGFLMKRNEQGVWQKRFCCLVPHMFLYYFENDVAESPRGVIDLEYFTEVDIQNGNVLKIAPASHVQANSGFFFQIDDATEMSDWMGSLHRDRYTTVRDERDAYQQLQDQFSGQMDMTAKMLEESAMEKEKLSYEVAHVQREIASAKLALHQVLTRTTVIANALDIPANDEADDFDTIKMGQAIKDKLDSIKKTYDDQFAALTETTTTECNNLKELVLSLQGQLATETQARRQAEAQCLQDKRESDMKLREAIGQIEKANHSYQMVWNMKTGLEEKQNKSSEQKKILVKEVKQLRKRLEESDDLNDQMSVVNDKLIAVTSDLRQQVETQRAKIDSQNAAILASTDIALQEAMRSTSATIEGGANTETETETALARGVREEADKLLEEARALNDKSTHAHQQKSASQNHTSSSQHSSAPGATTTPDNRAGASGGEIDQLLNERTTSSSSPSMTQSPTDVEVVTRGGRTASMEWTFPSESSSNAMLNMEWLSPEQRQLAEQRHSQQLQNGGRDLDTSQSGGGGGGEAGEGGRGSGQSAKSEKRSSMAKFKNAFSHLSIPAIPLPGSKDGSSNDVSSNASSSSSPSTLPTTASAGSPPSSSRPLQEHNSVGTTTPSTTSPSFSASHDKPKTFVDASYENGGKPTCFRCGGTVEGPKYSTCKCAIPAMSPLTEEELEKEEHGMQALKGFFKKGTSKAGGLASVARRKSMAVGKELFHHNSSNNNNSNSNSNSSTHGAAGANSSSGGNSADREGGTSAASSVSGSSGTGAGLLDLDDNGS